MAEQARPIELNALHAGGEKNAAHAATVKLALFNRIMCNHRALPLLFPFIGMLIIASLNTSASSQLTTLWIGAVILVWAEIAVFSSRYFAGRLSTDPDRLSRSLALRYLNANIIWSSMLLLFWLPANEAQDFFLLLLFVAHLSVATATTSYEWRVYFACTLPITIAISLVTLLSGDTIFMSVGVLVIMVYGFMVSVARQMIAQTSSSIWLRLEHDDLIRDLATAKAGSDTALADAEAANERLARSEQRFRALVDNAFDGVMIVSAEGNIRFATDAVARIYGGASEDLAGMSILRFGVQEGAPELKKMLTELNTSAGRRVRVAGWSRRLDGTKIWVEASGRNMLADPSVRGIVLNVRDATDRKTADGELKMHLGVLEKLATGSPMDQVLEALALAMEDLKPEMRASILLLDDDDNLRIGAAPSLPPDYAAAFDGTPATPAAGPCGTAATTGNTVVVTDAETDPIFNDKRELALAVGVGAVWSHPLKSRDGKVLGAVAMIYETPREPAHNELEFLSGAAQLAAIAIERRRAEQRLSEALRTAEIANHSKSQFLANMSHELRTPLNAIIGFSEMIREEMFGPVGVPEYADYIRDIHSSGRHLLELINDILDISKIEAGQFEIDESWVDLPAIAHWSKELMRHRADEGGVKIVLEGLDDLPEIFADERGLKQILLNLMSNATKFTPQGGTVTVTAGLDTAGNLNIMVADTGIGIEPHLIARVLEPFGQVEGPMTRNFGGTGLGLPITKSLAELHDGSLTLESEPGKGTCVTIMLPAARIKQDGPAPDEEPARFDAQSTPW